MTTFHGLDLARLDRLRVNRAHAGHWQAVVETVAPAQIFVHLAADPDAALAGAVAKFRASLAPKGVFD